MKVGCQSQSIYQTCKILKDLNLTLSLNGLVEVIRNLDYNLDYDCPKIGRVVIRLISDVLASSTHDHTAHEANLKVD